MRNDSNNTRFIVAISGRHVGGLWGVRSTMNGRRKSSKNKKQKTNAQRAGVAVRTRPTVAGKNFHHQQSRSQTAKIIIRIIITLIKPLHSMIETRRDVHFFRKIGSEKIEKKVPFVFFSSKPKVPSFTEFFLPGFNIQVKEPKCGKKKLNQIAEKVDFKLISKAKGMQTASTKRPEPGLYRVVTGFFTGFP